MKPADTDPPGRTAGPAIGSPAHVWELLAQDALEHPHGHPCRDCNQLFRDHPISNCSGWR